MPVNVLLCRWMGGWREVRHEASITAYGRREAFLSMGALQSPQEVDRVAGQQLEIFADPRTAIAADLEPMGIADRPYRAWNVGDTIIVPDYGSGTIAQRVRALTGSEDENGEITYSPELGDLILENQERMEQALKKLADGSMDGESPVATPVADTQQSQRVYGSSPMPAGGQLRTPPPASPPAPFQTYGWTPDRPYRVTEVVATNTHCVPAPGGTAAVLHHYTGDVGGEDVAVVPLVDGERTTSGPIDWSFTPVPPATSLGELWFYVANPDDATIEGLEIVATLKGITGTHVVQWRTE